jgi:hypothetical protein
MMNGMDDTPHIFISYRRADSSDVTERIHDRLALELGQNKVFLDVDKSIPAGVDFPSHLRKTIDECAVFLAIIGSKWLDVRLDENPELRRLDDPGDFVRLEIETALNDPSIIVIPVVIQDTPMPAPGDLPESVRNLARRQAAPARRNPYFHQDMTELIETIKGYWADPIFSTRFKRDMRNSLEAIRRRIPEVFEGAVYRKQRREILQNDEDRRDEILTRIEQLAAAESLILAIQSRRDWELLPLVEGRAVTPEELAVLPKPQRDAVTERRRRLQPSIDDALAELREIERWCLVKLGDHVQYVAADVVERTFAELKECHRENDRLISYIDETSERLLQSPEELLGAERYAELTSLGDMWLSGA